MGRERYMEAQNSQFKTKVGLIAATLGSAVGLGSIWRFPAEAQQNGGGAFLLVYIVCVLVLGIPVMVAETALGRAGRSDAMGVFKALSPKTKWWIGGLFGVVTSYLILCFYMVVAGWTLEYLWSSITGTLYSSGTDLSRAAMDATYHSRMEEYISSDSSPLIATWIMIIINIGVLLMGVQKGIERCSNIMMPMLFVLLLLFGIYSISLPGSAEGLEYFFKPDFSKISWGVVGNALGQTFFSLSLGMGILVTYASYYPKSTNLVGTSVTVSLLTTVVAILMGVIIFPTVFSYNMDLEQLRGTTLVFVTLPEVFAQMPGGRWWSILFFTLLLVAALTSTISIGEVSVSFIQRRFRKSRIVATLIVLLPLFIFSALCSLSFGSLSDIKIFGENIFNFLDMFTTNYLLPITSILAVLFIGWFAPKGVLRNEITNGGRIMGGLSPVVEGVIKYLAPVLILIIFIYGII